MKRFFTVFALLTGIAAMALSSCKSKYETNYVDLVQGYWHVKSVSPAFPDNKWFVVGDELELKSDMSMVLYSNWDYYFKSPRWTIGYNPDSGYSYLELSGTHEEDAVVMLFAKITGITEGSMFLETDPEGDGGTVYRMELTRVER